MKVLEGKLTAKDLRFGIVVGRFNEFISSKLLGGALDALKRHDAAEANIEMAWAPGSYEIPLIAKKMVEYDIIFAGFLPCRIAVLEDGDGKGWIVTMNMDMMLHAVDLPQELRPLATKVRDTIYSIVDAGVNGDL